MISFRGRLGRRGIGRGFTAGLCLLVFLAAFAGSAGKGYAEKLIDLEKIYPNLFPARIAAVVFESGSRLDAETPVGFGEWTVRYGEKSPKAYYRCESPCLGSSPPPVITIEGFQCENPDLGKNGCRMTILLRNKQPVECAFSGEAGESVQITVDCPVELAVP